MGTKLQRNKKRNHFFKSVKENRELLLMILPGIAFLFIFCYIPMYGVTISFKDFNLSKGITGSNWVGLKYFKEAFSDSYFRLSFRNTVYISALKLLFGFPAPIILALLLNEMQGLRYKKLIQTLTYLPHFISWVILGGIFLEIFSLQGVANYFVQLFGNKPILFLASKKYFVSILISTDIWKEIGWGAVIYLAALSGIDPELYEAAYIDGAGRFRQVLAITIPSLLPIIVIVLILSVGNILNAGFDQIFNLYNAQVREVSEIIDTYVYRKGLLEMEYSYSAAIGLFKSIIAFVLVVGTNSLCKMLGQDEYSLW